MRHLYPGAALHDLQVALHHRDPFRALHGTNRLRLGAQSPLLLDLHRAAFPIREDHRAPALVQHIHLAVELLITRPRGQGCTRHPLEGLEAALRHQPAPLPDLKLVQ